MFTPLLRALTLSLSITILSWNISRRSVTVWIVNRPGSSRPFWRKNKSRRGRGSGVGGGGWVGWGRGRGVINDHNYKHHGILEIVFLFFSLLALQHVLTTRAFHLFVVSYVLLNIRQIVQTCARSFSPPLFTRSYSVVLLTLRNDRHLILQSMP